MFFLEPYFNDLGEQTHTLVPCWMPKPCLQGTNVMVSLSQTTLTRLQIMNEVKTMDKRESL